MTMQTHTAKKRFGQNFLVDNAIIHKIISALQLQADDHCLEIGPGRGALTAHLLQVLNKLHAIEIDRDLIAALQQRFGEKLLIQQADILHVDLSTLTGDKPLRIIGNLPYNISTPILFHCQQASAGIKDMHFMLQKEVVDRICAKPNCKRYGRLSVMMQYYFTPTPLFDIPPTAFRPAPKVWSSVIRLIPYTQPPAHTAQNLNVFAALVQAAFNQRRKTLRNSLHAFMSPALWQLTPISPTQRAEQLPLADFVELSNIVHQAR